MLHIQIICCDSVVHINIRNIFGLLYVFPRFTLVTGYFGLSLNSVQLSTDPYIGCFISGAVEVPAYTCGWLALQYLPRRLSAIVTMLLGGASLFFIQLVPQSKNPSCASHDLSHGNSIQTELRLLQRYRRCPSHWKCWVNTA